MKDEKDKYYTPDISEFHVGFECEYEVSDIWESIIIGIEGAGHYNDIWCFEFSDYSNAINTKSIRVKYLDKEDIESLGFIKLPDIENVFKYKINYTTHGLKDTKEWFYWHISLLERSDKYPNLIISNNEDYDTLDVIFEGWIKNKSELKVLLKQLKIT